jgi:hypothetical protein
VVECVDPIGKGSREVLQRWWIVQVQLQVVAPELLPLSFCLLVGAVKLNILWYVGLVLEIDSALLCTCHSIFPCWTPNLHPGLVALWQRRGQRNAAPLEEGCDEVKEVHEAVPLRHARLRPFSAEDEFGKPPVPPFRPEHIEAMRRARPFRPLLHQVNEEVNHYDPLRSREVPLNPAQDLDCLLDQLPFFLQLDFLVEDLPRQMQKRDKCGALIGLQNVPEDVRQQCGEQRLPVVPLLPYTYTRNDPIVLQYECV